VSLTDRSGHGVADGEDQPILEAIELVRDYPSGDSVIHALRGVSLTASPGHLVAVRGRSGSG
jgi:putative ABC transport system ATP-binding protein